MDATKRSTQTVIVSGKGNKKNEAFASALNDVSKKVLKETTNRKEITIDQLDLVWFAHELGYKKCTIWGAPMGDLYAEVTYNRDKDEMYVDIYQKVSNTRITADGFNFGA